MREPVFKGQKLFGVIIALVFFIVCWTSIILISSDWNLQHFPSYHPLLKEWILPIRKPPLYIITPTWPRPVQIPELTRLGYVLKVYCV